MAISSNKDARPRALYRIPEFSKENGLSEAKTWDMIAKGELRAVKIGSATRIRTEDAQAWRDSLPPRL
jgi:excisionase family DNA binding protein